MNRFTRVFAGLADGIKTARLTHTLHSMSDRQLADIGFTRDEIRLRARELARVR